MSAALLRLRPWSLSAVPRQWTWHDQAKGRHARWILTNDSKLHTHTRTFWQRWARMSDSPQLTLRFVSPTKTQNTFSHSFLDERSIFSSSHLQYGKNIFHQNLSPTVLCLLFWIHSPALLANLRNLCADSTFLLSLLFRPFWVRYCQQSAQTTNINRHIKQPKEQRTLQTSNTNPNSQLLTFPLQFPLKNENLCWPQVHIHPLSICFMADHSKQPAALFWWLSLPRYQPPLSTLTAGAQSRGSLFLPHSSTLNGSSVQIIAQSNTGSLAKDLPSLSYSWWMVLEICRTLKDSHTVRVLHKPVKWFVKPTKMKTDVRVF